MSESYYARGKEQVVNIYVGNLPRELTESELRKAFEAYGKVDAVTIIKDKFTGSSRGFGFVEMPQTEEAKAAIAGMNGRELGGRKLTVNEARPKTEGQERRRFRSERRSGPRW